MLRIISGRFGPNCDRCLRKVSQRPVKKSQLTQGSSSYTSQSGPIVVTRNYSVNSLVSQPSSIHTDIILIRQLRQRNNYIRTLAVCIPRSRQIGTGLLDVHHATARQQYSTGNPRLLETGLLNVHHATARQQYRQASSGSLFGAVRRFLRIRYLILTGAVGGGMAANQTFEQWKKYVPDLEWMREYLPKELDLEKMAEPFNKARTLVRAISNTEKEWMKQKMEDFKKWTEKLENETDKDFFTSIITEGKSGVHAVLNPSSSDADRSLHSALPKIGFSSLGRETKPDSPDKSSSDRARQDSMNDEILNMQTKYQKEVDRLEKENKDLRKQLNLMEQKTGKKRKMKHSLIDMYSEILDVLTDFDSSYNTQDHLPRVVVVGDQSAGKTSVLEMIARARIFPRGSGEMMTRSPVKVTLSEGPFHVAQFKDSSREFDLTSASETEALRREVEMRMKKSVGKGQTVSNDCIAMSVKGPGIQRMVLVDLPGIISTETTGMAPDTKDGIKKLVRSYMENPNAIVLCIQDGSLDAERSNVTDVVREIDPSGKRTIFVLTKVDLAESSLYNPNRIKSILEGRLFPMKALGYFAVVTGKGNSNDSIESIREYEDQFFRHSKLLKDGALKPTQMNTQNLSMAVSEVFWKMVKENIEQQADAFKATRFNLETEWKNNFPRMRELDRDELFEKAKGEILDEIISLSLITPKQWETLFHKKLWEKTATYVFENIYLPAAQSDSTGEFNTVVDIKLTDWANHALPKKSIEVGWDALHEAFRDLTERDKKKKGEHEGHDELFNKLKLSVIEASKTTHNWDSKAEDSLRVIQRSILEDRSVQDKRDWDSSIQFMETILKEQLKRNETTLRDMVGPGSWEQWSQWKYRTPEHKHRSATKYELERILKPQNRHKPSLSQDELTTIRQTLQTQGIEVDTEFIKETWYHVFRERFIRKALQQCSDCKKGFYFYQNNVPNSGLDCHEVVLFWRLQRMLSVTSNALRQQVMNNEARRLERIIKDVLDDFLEDTESLKKLLTGRPVELAEELKKVRQIQEKLEEFIEALNREK